MSDTPLTEMILKSTIDRAAYEKGAKYLLIGSRARATLRMEIAKSTASTNDGDFNTRPSVFTGLKILDAPPWYPTDHFEVPG